MGGTDILTASLRLLTFRDFLSLNPSSFLGFHFQCPRLPSDFLSKTGGTGVRLESELPTKEERGYQGERGKALDLSNNLQF